MMYHLAEILTGISYFSILNKKVAFVKNNKFYVGTNEYNILPLIYSDDETNNHIWLKDTNWDNYLIILSNNHCQKLDFNLGLNGFITDTIIFFKDNILSCYSTIEKKVIINFPKIEKIKTYLSTKSNLIFQVETTLSSLSLLTGEYEWEVDLSKYGDINHILGVIDNELFVWQNRNTIVALNTQTGQELWHINIYEAHQAGDIYGIHFLPEERKVVIFDKIYYIEIDIATRSSSLLFKSAYSKSWEFATSTVSGNYIYFTGRNYGTGELSVGAFNRQSLQVAWYYAAPEWQGRVPDDYEGNAVVLNSAPQVSDDKLYVLENGTGTLYIFEKEQLT